MTQILKIIESLKFITADTPAIAKQLTELQHGTRISSKMTRPYGLLSVKKVGSEGNTSGVLLVTYEATLTIYTDNQVKTPGNILEIFHRYWDRITRLPLLDSVTASFVLIAPNPEPSEIGEEDREDLGNDVLLGITSWTIQLAEKQPVLEEED